MINIRTINKLQDNDGITLHKGRPIQWKSGYQIATEGVECSTPQQVMVILKIYKGDCGIWFHDGIYYVDRCQRVATKREAMTIGRLCHQISAYSWKKQEVVYIK